MSEIVEQEELTVLEGIVETPQKQQRLFKTLTALLDYCKVFNIENAAFGKTRQYGSNVYILEYMTQE